LCILLARFLSLRTDACLFVTLIGPFLKVTPVESLICYITLTLCIKVFSSSAIFAPCEYDKDPNP